MKLVAALIVVLAAVPAAQAADQEVTVGVAAAQVLEGVATLALSAGAPRRAQVVVKSNVPWTLEARFTGPAGAQLRVEGAAWTAIGDGTPVLRGGRGVHRVTYEVRSLGEGGRLVLSLRPAAEVRP
jgi:hypothetical protein